MYELHLQNNVRRVARWEADEEWRQRLDRERQANEEAEAADRQTRQVVQDRIENGELQLCSHCGALVNRTNGCDHMKCVCGFHFCYYCGAESLMTRCPGRTTTRALAAAMPHRRA